MVGGCGKLAVIHCMYLSLPGCIQQGSSEHMESWNWSSEEVLHTMSCSTMGASSDSHASPYPTLLIAVVQCNSNAKVGADVLD